MLEKEEELSKKSDLINRLETANAKLSAAAAELDKTFNKGLEVAESQVLTVDPTQKVIQVKEQELKQLLFSIEQLKKENDQYKSMLSYSNENEIYSALSSKISDKERKNDQIIRELKFLSKESEQSTTKLDNRNEVVSQMNNLKEALRKSRKSRVELVTAVKIAASETHTLRQEVSELNEKKVNLIATKKENSTKEEYFAEDYKFDGPSMKRQEFELKKRNDRFTGFEEVFLDDACRKQLKTILKEKEIDKLEERYQTLVRSIKTEEMKYSLDIKTNERKMVQQRESLNFTSMQTKELESKNVVLGSDNTELREENKISREALDNIKVGMDSIQKIIALKEGENKNLVKEMQMLKKEVQERRKVVDRLEDHLRGKIPEGYEESIVTKSKI